ncbi:hypothetical protein ACFQ68_13525 [Amycolatopsis japonica]|uniref:hypothetical protein n=1 Tax=Amycolatopsis japonica TaxID=208439 RepID=UPI00366FFF07
MTNRRPTRSARQARPAQYPVSTSSYDTSATPADTGGGQDSGNSCPAPDSAAPVDSGGACAS